MDSHVVKSFSSQFPMYVLEIKEGDEHIGNLNLYILAGHFAYLTEMHIKEDRRKQGYGSKLVHEAEIIAKQEGCEQLIACASKESHYNQRYFGKLGFGFIGHQLSKDLS